MKGPGPLSLLFAVAATLVTRTEAWSCSTYDTCTTCTAAAFWGCGWSSNTYQCMEGTANGPNSDSNPDTLDGWLWTTEGCACSLLGNCSICTATPFCGWAIDLEVCRSNTSAEVLDFSCGSPTYVYPPSGPSTAMMVFAIIMGVVLGLIILYIVVYGLLSLIHCHRQRATLRASGPTYAACDAKEPPLADGPKIGVV